MRLLFVLDPLASLKVAKDSSVAMMQAAQDRGHEVWAIEPAGLSLGWSDAAQAEDHVFLAQCLRLLPQTSTPMPKGSPWYEVLAQRAFDLKAFDAILMRKDPPFDQAFLTTTLILSAIAAQGLPVFNAPEALRNHGEKMAVLEFPEFAPPGLVSADPGVLQRFAQGQSRVVFKPLDAMGGEGVFVCEPRDPNIPVILEMLTGHGHRPIMAQQYLPAIREGDKRILIFNGEPIPYALARIPPEGASRGNLAAGGTGRAQPLTPRDREIAEAVGRRLAPRGLLLIGLDVIGDHLTEINVTSPTGFREIMNQTGFPVADAFITALEAQL